MMWVEKYRPRSFDEVVGLDKSIINVLENPQEMPHFLFVGRVGTGKTTLARLIIKHLNAEHIELNASDERGIDTIRNRVKQFIAAKRLTDAPRIVFLDEADALTFDAQTALRNMMEKYASNAKFILTANYENRIIEPIRSRCQIVRFEEPPKEEILERLKYICEQEGVEYDEAGLYKLIQLHYPDIRSMINALQLIAYGGNKITLETVVVYDAVYDDIYRLIKEGRVFEARKLWISKNLDARIVLKELWKRMMMDNIPRHIKDELLWVFAEADYRMAVGSDNEIQLTWFASNFRRIFEKFDMGGVNV